MKIIAFNNKYVTVRCTCGFEILHPIAEANVICHKCNRSAPLEQLYKFHPYVYYNETEQTEN